MTLDWLTIGVFKFLSKSSYAHLYQINDQDIMSSLVSVKGKTTINSKNTIFQSFKLTEISYEEKLIWVYKYSKLNLVKNNNI